MPRQIPEYLTFDDVLMKPGASSVLPAQVKTATRLTKSLKLSIPIISAAMDTVTEARLAIAMAQAGGLGIIHKNLEPDEQADQARDFVVAKIKRRGGTRAESNQAPTAYGLPPDAVGEAIVNAIAHLSLRHI